MKAKLSVHIIGVNTDDVNGFLATIKHGNEENPEQPLGFFIYPSLILQEKYRCKHSLMGMTRCVLFICLIYLGWYFIYGLKWEVVLSFCALP